MISSYNSWLFENHLGILNFGNYLIRIFRIISNNFAIAYFEEVKKCRLWNQRNQERKIGKFHFFYFQLLDFYFKKSPDTKRYDEDDKYFYIFNQTQILFVKRNREEIILLRATSMWIFFLSILHLSNVNCWLFKASLLFSWNYPSWQTLKLISDASSNKQWCYK